MAEEMVAHRTTVEVERAAERQTSELEVSICPTELSSPVVVVGQEAIVGITLLKAEVEVV